MGAMGAFIVALARGTLNVRDTFEALRETAFTTASLFTVLIGAWVFSNFVNLAGLPRGYGRSSPTTPSPPGTVMVAHPSGLSGARLRVRVAVDAAADRADLFPLVISLGYDPVWFGIIVVVVTEISLITPPVGLNVFVLRGVVPDVSTGTVFRGVTPFWIADIFRLALLVALPWLALALPNSM